MRQRPIILVAAFLSVLIVADRLCGLALGRTADGLAVSGGSSMFADTFHLNPLGSAAVSRQLVQDLARVRP